MTSEDSVDPLTQFSLKKAKTIHVKEELVKEKNKISP